MQDYEPRHIPLEHTLFELWWRGTTENWLMLGAALLATRVPELIMMGLCAVYMAWSSHRLGEFVPLVEKDRVRLGKPGSQLQIEFIRYRTRRETPVGELPINPGDLIGIIYPKLPAELQDISDNVEPDTLQRKFQELQNTQSVEGLIRSLADRVSTPKFREVVAFIYASDSLPKRLREITTHQLTPQGVIFTPEALLESYEKDAAQRNQGIISL